MSDPVPLDKNKAYAGAAGAGGGTTLGGAVAILIISAFWPNASPEAASALTIVCSALVAIPSALYTVYLTPHNGG